MPAEAPQHLKFFVGDTWSFTITFLESDGATAVDNTGCTAKMQVRASQDGSEVLEASTANGRITLGGANGKINVSIPPAVTASLAPAYYLYDIKLTFSTGVVETAAFGSIQVKPRITV